MPSRPLGSIQLCCYATTLGPMVHDRTDRVIGRSLRMYGEWGPGETCLLGRLIGEGDHVIDVGANIGFHTLFFAACIGVNGKVYAFEPDRHNRALLELNLMLAAVEQVQVLPCLVGPRTEVIRFWRAEMENLNRGGLSFKIEQPASGGSAVPASEPLLQVALDDLGVEACALIKIDVEGAEFMVLSGAGEMVSRHRPIVFAEQRDTNSFAEIHDYFMSRDYVGYWSVTRAYPEFNFHSERENFFRDATEVNVLWVPREQCDARREILDQLALVEDHEYRPPALSQLAAHYFPRRPPPPEALVEQVHRINVALGAANSP